MTPQQLHAYVAFCQCEVLESAAEQHDRAVGLVVWHLRHQTPARWLPDILYAQGLPRFAGAIADILSL